LEKIKERFANFQKALLRLKEAIEERSDNPLLYDRKIAPQALLLQWNG